MSGYLLVRLRRPITCSANSSALSFSADLSPVLLRLLACVGAELYEVTAVQLAAPWLAVVPLNDD